MVNEIVTYLNYVITDLGMNNTYNEVIGKRLGAFDFMDIYELPKLRMDLEDPEISIEISNVNTRYIHNRDENKFSHILTNENLSTYSDVRKERDARRPYGTVAMPDNTPDYNTMEIVPITGNMAIPIRKNIYEFFLTPAGIRVWTSFSKVLKINIKYDEMINMVRKDYSNTTVKRVRENMSIEDALYNARKEYDKIK